MQTINLYRITIGGVVAGLIILCGEYFLNGVVLAEHWSALREDFGIGQPSAAQFSTGAVLTLFYGITLIWIYAAIRPRFGPGPKTAIMAGITFWFIAYLLFLLSVWANGFVTLHVAVVSIVWGLFEANIAALAGAWLYRDTVAT